MISSERVSQLLILGGDDDVDLGSSFPLLGSFVVSQRAQQQRHAANETADLEIRDLRPTSGPRILG